MKITEKYLDKFTRIFPHSICNRLIFFFPKSCNKGEVLQNKNIIQQLKNGEILQIRKYGKFLVKTLCCTKRSWRVK